MIKNIVGRDPPGGREKYLGRSQKNRLQNFFSNILAVILILN